MKIFLDTANLDELKKGAAWGIVDGVTTNPSLIAKEGREISEQIRMICDIVDGDISAEVVQTEAGAMIREGRQLAKIHKNIVVKCPLTRDGIQATRALSQDGLRVNVTLCFSAAQALLAAKAGAYIISPFVGRLDDIGQNGMDLIRSIATIYRVAYRHHAAQGAGYAVQSSTHRQGARPVPQGLCEGLSGSARSPLIPGSGWNCNVPGRRRVFDIRQRSANLGARSARHLIAGGGRIRLIQFPADSRATRAES
jgi:transaldolase